MRKQKFLPGQSVRFEVDATIIEQVADNEYWYLVELSNGTQERVSVGRLSAIAEVARAASDFDGSLLILSNRLSLTGVKSLLDLLTAHIAAFDEETYQEARSTAIVEITE